MFCRKCGNGMPDDSLFCPKCGMKVTKDNNDENQQTEQSDLNKMETQTLGVTHDQETRVPTEERKRKTNEAERKSKKVRTVLTCSILGICVVVPFILYFSLRQFGYTHKNDGWYISRYYGSDTDVTVPTSFLWQDVVGIAEKAFEGSNVESVMFSSNSNNANFTVEERAFYNCKYLETVSFNSLIVKAEIYANAFENCTSLDTLEFCGRRFNSLSKMRESQSGKTNKIDYDSLSPEEAKKARQEASSKIIEASSLSKFKFNKNAFTGCTKFNDVE